MENTNLEIMNDETKKQYDDLITSLKEVSTSASMAIASLSELASKINIPEFDFAELPKVPNIQISPELLQSIQECKEAAVSAGQYASKMEQKIKSIIGNTQIVPSGQDES